MVFKSNSKQTSQESDENLALIAAAANSVSPVNELNAENQAALCKSASISHMQRNDVLKPENAHRWLMYLVEGSVALYNGKDEVGTLSARTNEAAQPLFSDKEAYQSIKTPAMAKIVKFGREQMDILSSEQQKNAVKVVDVQVTAHDNLLFDDIQSDIVSNSLKLASFNESAAKILTSIGGNSAIPELAEIIQSDPGLSAQIVRLANRAEGGSGDSIQSIRGAISRLGVEATMQGLTEQLKSNTVICANKVIEDRFRRYVSRTTLAGAISQVVTKELPHLNADTATLNAVLSDIGELVVISYANRHADEFTDPEQLASTIENLRGILSVWVLSHWDFPAEIIDSATNARDWYRNHPGEISYADVMTAALLIIQSEMPESEHSSIPSATNLLLARRLQQAGIDLQSPGAIIQAATSHVVGVQDLLKAG